MPNFTETLPVEELEIVRYFLGDVTDEELDRIGEKTVVDLEYSEFAEAMAFELMAAYHREELTDAERALYERNFLISTERREQHLAMGALEAEIRRRRAIRQRRASQSP